MPHVRAHSFAPTAHGDAQPWLNDYFRHIAEEIRDLGHLLVKEPQHVEPNKVFDGLIEFADGTDWDPGRGRGLYIWTEDPDPGEWNYLESFSVNREGFGVNWRNTWTQDLYYQGDLVRDGEWTMIANKDTTDRAGPQPIGLITSSLPDTPTWDALQQNTSVIWSGHTYTFTENGWAKELRIWAPELTVNTNYRIILEDITDPENVTYRAIEEPVLLEDDWTTILLTKEVVRIGDVWRITLDSLNAGSSTEVTGDWGYGGADNTSPPLNAQWNHNTQQRLLRIDNDDADTVDRHTELLGIVLNSTITFVDTLNPTNFIEYRVIAPPSDQTTWVRYTVTVVSSGGDIALDVTTTMTAVIPVPSPTKYRRLTNQWVSGEPTWATVTGLLAFDGVTQAGNDDNAFGVDISFQQATVSDDWDLVALSDT